ENVIADGFNIYPNPFSDKLTVTKSNEGEWKMILRDVSGREISRQSIVLPKTEIGLNELSSGIYFAEFNNGQTAFIKRIAKL
ncbi:MAG: secreted reprolysin family zinc metalloprotease with Por secretion system C-terminal sorting domain, partial [Bacteroidota bacterium]|nr:secreted reprolysin family zinc metalloprotease with Por secretion system C-terminal sorting domain [Bacteroidota bacterium]